MGITVADHLRSVIATKRQMKTAAFESLINHTKLVEYFQAARLQTLAARADEIRFRLVDNSKGDAAPSQLASQCKARGACACDQN